MDETSYEIETGQVARMSERFPAHRRPHQPARPQRDLGWLAGASETSRHAWDEGGHL